MTRRCSWKHEAHSAKDLRQKLVRATDLGFLGALYVQHTGSTIMTTAVEVGQEVTALVKATDVMLLTDEGDFS